VDVDPHEVEIGLRVRATFRKLREEGKAGVIHYGYKFAPAEDPGASRPAGRLRPPATVPVVPETGSAQT
jgi:hypothetical protein